MLISFSLFKSIHIIIFGFPCTCTYVYVTSVIQAPKYIIHTVVPVI